MNSLGNLALNTKAWALLALTALAFELSALFFQYALDLPPCIMCVYQRLAILSVMFAGILGACANQFMLARLVAWALWGTGAIWGLFIAIQHVEMQSATSSLFFTCDIVPNFPAWAPLHQWFPWLFEATGDCGDVSWQFIGYSMPQWMIVIYGVYSAAFASVLLSRLIKIKSI